MNAAISSLPASLADGGGELLLSGCAALTGLGELDDGAGAIGSAL